MASSKSAKKRKQAQRRHQAQERQVHVIEDARRVDARKLADGDEIVSTDVPGLVVSDDANDDPMALGVTSARAGAVNWVIVAVVVLVLFAMAWWLVTRTPV